VKVPGMKWSKLLGGAGPEWIVWPGKSSLVDRDGQYIIGGRNNSTDGDVIGNHTVSVGVPSYDIWVVKLDTQRNILWSASLGGSGVEELGSLQLAHDSGYIVTGFTNSNDGNVTGNHGGGDAWIVRLGSKGNVVWQKCLGGTKSDVGRYITPTADGYIVVGESMSIDGDVTGGHGGSDIWVVKLDKNGNIMWQKCLGGSNEEKASGIKQTADGGYIISGTTHSNDGDVQGFHGSTDMWVVKLTSNGALEWQKCLGGSYLEFSYDIELTATGGYIVAGSAQSDDGDVNGIHSIATDSSAIDAWVVSLSSTGAVEWQKCFGGTNYEEFFDLQIMPDKTFIVVGETYSNDGDVSFINAGGMADCWLVNFNNNNGNIIWEKTFGTTAEEHGVTLSLKNNGNIVIAGYITNRWLDIWMLEVGSVNTIAGYVFYDANSNGIKDNGESFFDKVTIRSGKNGDTMSAIPQNGYYSMDVDTGTYSTKAVPYNIYYNIIPAVKTTTFNSYFNTDSIHFAVQPLPNLRDVTVSMIPLTVARPGFTAQYRLLYKNVGTNTVGAGNIKLVKDRRLSLTSAVPAATSVSGDTVTWNYSNLAPNVEVSITLNFVVGTPPSVNLGDTLKSIAWIEHDGIDVTSSDDTVTLKQIVIGSFDPNDKTEANAGIITPAQVTNGDYLNYLIRFQNTGTDTAFNITVRDTLENRLNWNSLQMISASHSYQLAIEDGNKLTWQFNNIKLPYTAIDEPNSHGYIAYRIKPKSTVPIGDTIRNTAGIYFDYNLPVATNTEKTIVFQLSPLPVTLVSFNAALTGSVVNVTWKTSIEENVKHFEVLRSANGVDFTTIGTVRPGQTNYLFVDEEPLKGYNYYRLKSVDLDGSASYSTIVLVNVKNGADIISSLYPNPANGHATLKLEGIIEGHVIVQVLDQQGRQVAVKQFGIQNTNAFKAPLDLGNLSKGNYVLRIVVNDKIYLHKLLIQ
ncbi:MAG TPA: T9SS type A sorting domain-containing protein, partial [Niastella sp.]